MDWFFITSFNQSERKIKSQFFVFSSLAICGIGLIFYILLHCPTYRTVSTEWAKLNHSREMFAKGVSFYGYQDAQKTLSFNADTIEISRKKIGFFRIGFYKTATINGLQIDIFFYPEHKNTFEATSLDIEQYLLNESFNVFRLDNIKELEIKNVEINFYHDNQKASSIQSGHAGIKFYNNDLTFYGNVVLSCKDKGTLHSDSLRWGGEEKQFSTEDSYRLVLSESSLEGKGISCDYLLNKITFLSEPKKLSTTF